MARQTQARLIAHTRLQIGSSQLHVITPSASFPQVRKSGQAALIAQRVPDEYGDSFRLQVKGGNGLGPDGDFFQLIAAAPSFAKFWASPAGEGSVADGGEVEVLRFSHQG
jgi:hypothetical protein